MYFSIFQKASNVTVCDSKNPPWARQSAYFRLNIILSFVGESLSGKSQYSPFKASHVTVCDSKESTLGKTVCYARYEHCFYTKFYFYGTTAGTIHNAGTTVPLNHATVSHDAAVSYSVLYGDNYPHITDSTVCHTTVVRVTAVSYSVLYGDNCPHITDSTVCHTTVVRVTGSSLTITRHHYIIISMMQQSHHSVLYGDNYPHITDSTVCHTTVVRVTGSSLTITRHHYIIISHDAAVSYSVLYGDNCPHITDSTVCHTTVVRVTGSSLTITRHHYIIISHDAAVSYSVLYGDNYPHITDSTVCHTTVVRVTAASIATARSTTNHSTARDSYPYNPSLKPTGSTSQLPNPRQVQQATPPKQRVFTGTVTKLHDNFGFVDEDVFFQTSCVKGLIPKVGERVLVEATYNPNMPFKWNATRIQLLPNQQGSNQGKPSVMGQSVPSSLMGDNPGNRPFSSKKGERFRDRERKGFSDIKKEPRERPERPLPLKKRSRSRTPKRGDRSGSPRRRMRVVPRYVVQIPKLSFNLLAANVVTLKSRYSSMYVPSDFFKANFTWMDAFPLTRPFQLGRNCEFHVLHKDVESINTSDALLDPPDADHSFNAKVMLLSCPELEDLYHKSCSLSEDAADVQENFVHPTRLIHFLVGVKGKNETMAIGGAWSPSQDGLNPDEDPKVLIKTAIRTTKALTGIDLSACTQWYRFAEVRYLRPEEIHKGKHLPTRVETTVIFFPDVWSCSPSRLEWASLQTAYKKQLQKKIAAISDGPKDTSSQAQTLYFWFLFI
ncbi:Cell division cycle and apoptosis regulator protein 1 [Mytilus edulis]|uniref:Cell division cycle and apoptosis regulator protein 1 n=1 Tax=Mytilus edulis TaxID=6550 RepID=A0A8S3SP18_MYTED|nr:Cell division cycle and apoptosis regulator protein 1 [Mytilus edulis]